MYFRHHCNEIKTQDNLKLVIRFWGKSRYSVLIPKQRNSQKSSPSFDRPISNPYGKVRTS